MLKALTINPARLLGLHSGRLAKGPIADLVLFDPGEPWVVNKDLLRSRSKNTPFDEARCRGACSERWLPAKRSINTLASNARKFDSGRSRGTNRR